jgi:hypothetical protein
LINVKSLDFFGEFYCHCCFFVIFSIEFDSLLVGLERKAEINENKAEFTHLQ